MRSFLGLFCSVILAGCGAAADAGPTGPDYTKVAAIQIQNPISVGAVGQVVDIKFITLNAAGGTLISAPVSVATSAGTSSATTVVTDVNGAGVVEWKLGSSTGVQTLTLGSPGTNISVSMPVTVTLTFPIAGAWRGTVGTQILSITLVENNGVVTGSGTLTNTPTGTRAGTITGVLSGSRLSVTFSSGTLQPFNLDATVTGSAITGALNGSGFAGDAITLTRQ